MFLSTSGNLKEISIDEYRQLTEQEKSGYENTVAYEIALFGSAITTFANYTDERIQMLKNDGIKSESLFQSLLILENVLHKIDKVLGDIYNKIHSEIENI